MALANLLISWRTAQGLSQSAAARVLGLSQSTVSRIETGVHVVRDVGELLRLAAALGVPAEALGVVAEGRRSHRRSPPEIGTEDQEEWRQTRSFLDEHRADLARAAADLHPDAVRIAGTPVLGRDDWMFQHPVAIEDIELRWAGALPPLLVDGRGPLSGHVRPTRRDGKKFDRYSHAVRDLARPRLYENRVCYRLVDVHTDEPALSFALTSYFDVVDVSEGVAHELAGELRRRDGRRPSTAALPLRRAVEDVFDLTRRPVFPSINTLTIRRDPIDGHRMYLHARDARAVAVSGGMHHVAPAGAFQPASVAVEDRTTDFDLWRCLAREFSEEFLGDPEHDGSSSRPIDYELDEPFASFSREREAGRMRTRVLGVVIEPLTLWVELLTVTVVEADAFDVLFAGMVEVNDEGRNATVDGGSVLSGQPFTSLGIARAEAGPLSPIATASIRLAWKHRFELLGR